MSQKPIKDFTDDALVDRSGLTIGGAPDSEGLKAQAELTRRLKDSIKNLDESTSRFSKVIIALTLVLIVVACLQLVVTIFAPFPDDWRKYVIFFIILGVIGYTFRKVVKDFLV